MREVSVGEVVTRDCPQLIVMVNAYTAEGRAAAMPTGWAMLCRGSPFLSAVAFCGEHSGRAVDKQARSGGE